MLSRDGLWMVEERVVHGSTVDGFLGPWAFWMLVGVVDAVLPRGIWERACCSVMRNEEKPSTFGVLALVYCQLDGLATAVTALRYACHRAALRRG